jgi:hypothetical protein
MDKLLFLDTEFDEIIICIIFVVVPRTIVIKNTKEFNASIGWQIGHDMILIRQYMFQGPSLPFLQSV